MTQRKIFILNYHRSTGRDLAKINNGNDVDAAFSKFYNDLDKIVSKHAPLLTLSKRKIKHFSMPWITRALLKSIKVKNALFASGNFEEYKFYCNKIPTHTQYNKKLYYYSYFNDHLTNMQKTWIGIIQVICRNKMRCKPIVALKRSDCNESIRNAAELPNILNDFFSSVGQKLATSVPAGNRHFSNYLPTINSSSSFFFEPVTSLEIETEILLLPSNKAHSLYSCPIRVLKSSRGILSLAQTMNTSVITGQYPCKLKHGKIIPAFKGGDKTDPSNYRPISLLSLFNRP